MQASSATAVRATAFALLSIAAVQANAQDGRAGSRQEGGYIGVGIGQLNYEEDLSAYLPGFTFDESSSAISVYGGYRFGGWGIEGGYRDVDTLEHSETQFVSGFGSVSAAIGTDVESLEIRVLGYVPVGRGSFVFGGGYADWDFTSYVSLEATGFPSERYEDSDSDSGAMGVLGYQLELDRIDIRFSWELWDIEDGDADQLSVGLGWRF